MARKIDIQRLTLLMDIDQAIRDAEETILGASLIQFDKLKAQFYDSAGEEFDRSVLGEIHETTIENIIKKQATYFYGMVNFPEDLKNELMEDFVDMEHHRRRDNFPKFSLSIYKQLEAITNHYFNQVSFIKEVEKVRCEKVFSTLFTSWDLTKKETILKHDRYGYKMQNKLLNIWNDETRKFYSADEYNLFFDTHKIKYNLSKLSFLQKFKIVLYVIKYKSVVSEQEYEKDMKVFEAIRQSRHLTHGGKLSTALAKKETDRDRDENVFLSAIKNKYFNYLSYQGFLANLVESIISH